MPPETRPAGTPSVPWVPVTDITQQETYDIGPDGRPTLGWKIQFTTPSGSRASVFVPLSRYTVENARAAIAQRANQVEAVHRLAGPM